MPRARHERKCRIASESIADRYVGKQKGAAKMAAPLDYAVRQSWCLLLRHARRDRSSDPRSRLELRFAVIDAMAPRDPAKIRIGGPDFALVVLEQQQPHRPIKPRVLVGGDELRAERRIAKGQEYRRPQRNAGTGGEFRLIDLAEEHDALAGDVLLQAHDGLRQRIDTLRAQDPVIRRAGTRRAGERHIGRYE